MTLEELVRYIGQTVTVFTTSGGASSYGFTGVLLRVNFTFITLVNRFGPPPASPVSDVMYPERRGTRDCRGPEGTVYGVGSLCEIPIDKIAAFSHYAIRG